MHIAVIRRKYTARGGGAEKYTMRMVEGLIQRGHEVSVLSEIFTEQENELLHWVRVPKSLVAASKTAAFHKKVQAVLARHEFDVVYGLCRTFPVDVLRITEQLHIEWHPMEYPSWSRYLPRHKSILNLEKSALQKENAKYVVTNSNLVKEQIVSHYHYPKDRIKVIYNGIDPTVFYPANGVEKRAIREQLNFPASDKIILFVAANFKIKGLESAIRVLSNVKKEYPNIQLVVVGGGDSAPYQALAEVLSVQEHIIFKGKQRDMRSYYAAADLLLYPSLYEPFGNVCLEAFACGTPVITTRRNGSYEIIDVGANGFTVASADEIDEMARYTKVICSLSSLEQQKFSDSALKKSVQFRWENHINAVDDLFNMIAKG
jgi:UDP-glucose:(heptosyl)LPS alpha-1,3-glucosyltransferase